MSLRNILSRLFPRKTSRSAPLGRWFRLRLEHLEDRTLPSVTLLFDSAAGNLSLIADGSNNTIQQGG